MVARRPLALSPSRAGDFRQCPLLYRFRVIDRLPEPPSSAAVRGTLVHAVLEQMFGRAPSLRTADITADDVVVVWARMLVDEPELADLLPAAEVEGWLDSARRLVRSYFTLEDPRRLSPESCELRIEIDVGSGVPLRGFVDRIDVAPGGQIRVVDYKTGSAPSEMFEAKAIYQLKFYALMLWKLRGVLPTQLKLLYLADRQPLVYAPDESEMRAFERSVSALWTAISAAIVSGNFPPNRSKMCGWCSFQSLCPEFGGTSPPYPGPPAETDS